MTKKRQTKTEPQSKKLIKKAREIEAEESGKAFERAFSVIAPSKILEFSGWQDPESLATMFAKLSGGLSLFQGIYVPG